MKGLFYWKFSRKGQAMVEYVLLLALLAMVAFGAVMALGINVQNLLYNPAMNATP